MRRTVLRLLVASSWLALAATGCVEDATPPGEIPVGEGDSVKSDDKSDSSVEAVFVDFEFEASLLTDSSWSPKDKIEDQLLYTIGHLNGDRGVGRLDLVQLTDIKTESVDGRTRIAYHARLPVAWGRRTSVPAEYKLKLPKDISYSALNTFAEKYGHSCVDWGAHDVDSGSMWYYYRPAMSGCRLEANDIIETVAKVSISAINTTGKYPEYHKVWEDDLLRVVAIFGKYEDGATTSSDAGIAAYNSFIASVKTTLASNEVVTTPATVPTSPGVEVPDVVFAAQLPGGKRIEINALLVDNIRTTSAEFDARYEALSRSADLIAYNGHAGLGSNVRALARKGSWVTGQYVIVFLNGCDSFAYVDSALADAHSAVNSDDPNGTRYLDTITNAMPAFFVAMDDATMALVRGLMKHDDPMTFEQMFKNFDKSQVVLVSGEQDNEFFPGWDNGGGTTPARWDGLDGNGTVARDEEVRFETPTLDAGAYVFEMTGTRDADLYVRVGQAPTAERYDCRPYKTGSNETCAVELTSPAPIHVMVRGYATSSTYTLRGSVR